MVIFPLEALAGVVCSDMHIWLIFIHGLSILSKVLYEFLVQEADTILGMKLTLDIVTKWPFGCLKISDEY